MIGAKRKAEIAARDQRIADLYRRGMIQADIAAVERISPASVSLSLARTGERLAAEEARRRVMASTSSAKARAKAAASNTRPVKQRFFEKARPGQEADDCWGWAGWLNSHGYPEMYWRGKRAMASHVSLALDGRPRPQGLYALHTCDNPKCTNPRHLWWGTQADNIRDAKAKGRLNLDGLALGLPARLAKVGS